MAKSRHQHLIDLGSQSSEFDFEQIGIPYGGQVLVAKNAVILAGPANTISVFNVHMGVEATWEVRSPNAKLVSLDPLSLIIGADLAEEFVIAHRFEQAITQSRKTMTLDPFFGNGHYVLGQALAQEHRYKEAIAELQKAIELSPGSTAFAANLAFAYAASGRTEDAVKILNGKKNRPPDAFSNAAEIALIYVGLNDKDQAMAWLENAYF